MTRRNALLATRCVHRPAQQRGASLLFLLLVLGLVAFFVTLAVRMGPSYVTFWQIRTVVDRVAQKPDLLQGGPAAVLKAINNQLTIEGVRSVDSKAFNISKDGDQLKIVVVYEERKPAFGNVDVVMNFRYEKPIGAP